MSKPELSAVPKRRSYPKALKAQIVAQCSQPGTSIAGVALPHGMKADLVHKWIRQAERQPPVSPAFVSVALPVVPSTGRDIEIRLSRGPVQATVQWPVSEAGTYMRAGTETALARVVAVFGVARPHHVTAMSIASLDHLDAQQLRALAERLMGEAATRDEQLSKYDAVIARRDQMLHFKQTHIDQLTQELALYKRWRYGKRGEQLNPAQASLLEETMDADMAAIEAEVDTLREVIAAKPAVPQAPRRMRLPPESPRADIHHEPASTTCRCGCGLKRIGEDVSEKLDYLPGVFSVERHIRGKWVCDQCETLTRSRV